jgi:hypothetical protein
MRASPDATGTARLVIVQPTIECNKDATLTNEPKG